jgi:hypothetical protein
MKHDGPGVHRHSALLSVLVRSQFHPSRGVLPSPELAEFQGSSVEVQGLTGSKFWLLVSDESFSPFGGAIGWSLTGRGIKIHELLELSSTPSYRAAEEAHGFSMEAAAWSSPFAAPVAGSAEGHWFSNSPIP